MALDQDITSLLALLRPLNAEVEELADRLTAAQARSDRIFKQFYELLRLQRQDQVDYSPGRPPQPSGKYQSLAEWLQGQRTSVVAAHFRELEAVLGFPLPTSARKQVAAWYGVQGSSLARAIRGAGFRASRVDVVEERVEFHRTGSHL